MPKILITALEARGFINKFFGHTITELKKRGWTVDVACTGDEQVPNCDTHHIMDWKRYPLSIKTILSIAKLRKIIEEGDYDIVHCNTPVGGYVTRLAARKARKKGLKVIYCAHGFHFHRGAKLGNWIYYPIEKWLARFTDVLLTINNEDYQLAITKRFPAKEIRLINGVGVDIDNFVDNYSDAQKVAILRRLGIDDDCVVLSYIADVNKNKNQQYLIKMMTSLKKSFNARLLLIGPEKINLPRRKAKQLGVEEYVKFLGWRSDIVDLLAITSYVVPSSIREGLPTNLIEAMAMGRAVVATKNRGHNEIIEDGKNGYLVSLNDSKQMADKIMYLEQNKPIREQIITNAKLSIKKYEFVTVFEDLYAIYASLIRK